MHLIAIYMLPVSCGPSSKEPGVAEDLNFRNESYSGKFFLTTNRFVPNLLLEPITMAKKKSKQVSFIS